LEGSDGRKFWHLVDHLSGLIAENPFGIPQGLKPHIFAAFFGPAKAVPLLQTSLGSTLY
jgi:hypothetical protein